MSDQLSNDLVRQLLQLPYEQRGQLANALIDSLHPASDGISQDEWRSAWTEECHRRLAEVDEDNVEMISADDLIARMREKHGE